MKKIAIIGGTGLEDPDIIKEKVILKVSTPYGKPSSELITGKIEGVDVVILSRHDRRHTIPPTQVNNKANIFALKEQGCTHIMATTACGSLREDIGRGDLVIIDQFIDFTRHRDISFYDEFVPGDLRHTPMADPFSEDIREVLIDKAKSMELNYHDKGTVVTIEGPRFSTRAESKMFRLWGADVINMSTAPEVILANELGIPYGVVAMSTDYDCWKTDEEPVRWEDVLKIFNENVNHVISLLINVIRDL
jgi:5'-methylthioadenosine phosphorylase